MPDVRIVPASRKHAACLAPHLSEADRAEVAASSGADPLDALEGGVMGSRIRTALVQDGKCLAIWGFIDGGSYGAPWMLSAEPSRYCFKAKRRLLEGSRRDVARALRIWPELRNSMMDSNHHHKRLLQKLGFVIGAPTQGFAPFEMKVSEHV